MKWISVSDRLPESNILVLVYIESEEHVVSECEFKLGYRVNDWWSDEYGRGIMATVTHWLPLPEPPKEE